MQTDLEQKVMMLIVTVNAIDEKTTNIQDNYELVDSYSILINEYVANIKAKPSDCVKLVQLLSSHEEFFRKYSNGLVGKYEELILDGRSFKTANKILKLDSKIQNIINNLQITIRRFSTKTKGDI